MLVDQGRQTTWKRSNNNRLLVFMHIKPESNPQVDHIKRASTFPLTEVRLIGTTLEFDSFRAALNQEVPHQLVGDVACGTDNNNATESRRRPWRSTRDER